MARVKTLQSNFGAGELAPDYRYRLDTTQYAAGALDLTNCRVLIGGGVESRPGTVWLAQLQGDSRLFEWVVDESTKYVIALGHQRMDAYLRDGSYMGSLTGCPWTLDTLWQLDWCQNANTAFITHKDMPPQRIVRTGASTWTRDALAFTAGPAGRLEQPYYKFANRWATLQPSARTGSITLTSSEPLFQAGHVGTRMRYAGREVVITAVTSSTVASATVTEELPMTMEIDIVNTMGFSIGDLVEGDLSGARGIVVFVDLNVIRVVLVEALTPFYTPPSGTTALETIIGPTGSSKASISGPTEVSPAPFQDWDEQLFSPVRGFPGCVEIHRARLCFGGHKALPGAFLASRVDDLYNFNIGDGSDGDAIFETIGDSSAAQIMQLHSAEQLILMTDRGPYYVPETPANPFRPSGMAFFPFGGVWPISRAPARSFDGGVLMVSGSLVIKARPTGDTTRAWMADEVSLLANHLFKSPRDIAVTSNFAGVPERYAVFVNEDGTLGVMQLVEAQEIRNVTPWKTRGAYRSVACLGSDAFVCVRRTVNGATVYLLERFDTGITLDATITYADRTALANWTAVWGTTDVEIVTADLRNALGAPPFTLDVDIGGPFHVGMRPDPDFTIETLPPIVEINGQVFRGEPMRILRMWVEARDSARFSAKGMELTAFHATDAVNAPPPRKNGAQVFSFLGWKVDPTVVITRAEPLPIRILGVKMEVAV